jgi:hypothetical protein
MIDLHGSEISDFGCARPYGRGSFRNSGVMRTCGRRTPDGGRDVTTSGSWPLFFALSMAENTNERRPLSTIGAANMRWARLPQLGQDAFDGALPSGRMILNAPWLWQWYS